MKNIFSKEDLLKPLKIGEILKGKVIGKGRSSVFLDLGVKGTGIIYGKEFYETKDKIKDLKIGDSLFVKVMDQENEQGYIELSATQAEKGITWEILRQKKEKGETVQIKIKGANKGGLLTEISGIPGFLPVSQLSSQHYPKVEGGETSQILRKLQKFTDQEMEVKIFDLSQKANQIILSEKVKESDKIKETLKNYKVGDVMEGEITGLTDFGAFIRFGKENLEGLIHISELDWKIIQDPGKIVKIGEKVKAKIIEISNNKVSLSIKALKEDPWMKIEKKYKKGDIVSGKVTKFNFFGAFVQITSSIQGLCHISEFKTKSKMEEKLKIGKEHNFQILEILPKEHRMSLKLVE